MKHQQLERKRKIKLFKSDLRDGKHKLHIALNSNNVKFSSDDNTPTFDFSIKDEVKKALTSLKDNEPDIEQFIFIKKYKCGVKHIGILPQLLTTVPICEFNYDEIDEKDESGYIYTFKVVFKYDYTQSS